MGSKNGDIVKIVYREWKKAQCNHCGEHPDEEAFACYIDGRLGIEEKKKIEGHITRCASCSQILSFSLGMGMELPEDVPQEFIDMAKGLVKEKALVFEISAQIKNGILELISASGDILIDQELVPVSLLRSRNIKGFKDEVTLFKDLKDIRVELKIRVKSARKANFEVLVSDRYTSKPLKEVRISLLKNGIEMESYLSDIGKALFENIQFGRYEIEISSLQKKAGIIILDLNV